MSAQPYGDPAFYVIQRDQALRSVASLTTMLEETRQKLQDTLSRASAAEARATNELKRREAAEAALKIAEERLAAETRRSS